MAMSDSERKAIERIAKKNAHSGGVISSSELKKAAKGNGSYADQARIYQEARRRAEEQRRATE